MSRQLLLGSLPIVMMFDLPESLQVEETVISKLQVHYTLFLITHLQSFIFRTIRM